MNVNVKCSVSNCYFWRDNNDCAAPAIMVTVDENAQANFNVEIADEIMVDLEGKQDAPSSAKTCCHTFRPSES
ncbi:hypothetical protein AAC03nite_01290 [Alicyclobacillus acidoterrestris]|uniref:DUF1540 domain-containing protein n=1 Tax=Alicyclobacillus suci TaxID=2816080 RepID=UPI00119279EC|nr:DUF1540 domain-containing protein [Alicyclobacillus suci]GEO24344.1 hypothetical protein AAC03nite_01290 [Alicyclobacillus acidoterrestris]